MTFSLGRVVLKEAKEDMWLGFKTPGTFFQPKVVPGPWSRKQTHTIIQLSTVRLQ